MAGIYVHIPFCNKRCIYCDFFLVTNLELVNKFLSALHKEIELASPLYKEEEFDTIYFGGGTPSILSHEQISSIISVFRNNFNISGDPEITLEANPEDLSNTNLEKIRNTGVNRLSIGVQSFIDDELKFLTRQHTGKYIDMLLDDVKKYFNNYSIDIIYSLPGQTEENINYSIEKAIGHNVPHISAYALTFEERTVLYRQMQREKIKKNPEDTESDMFIFVSNKLSENGYTHYEISSFSKPGFEARHNGKYWNYENYLGFGPSSHSFYKNKRWNNVKSINKYSEMLDNNKLPSENENKLTKDEQKFEFVMTALRSNGVNFSKYNNLFKENFLDSKAGAVKLLVDNQFAEISGEKFKLTRIGFRLADEIIAKYF